MNKSDPYGMVWECVGGMDWKLGLGIVLVRGMVWKWNRVRGNVNKLLLV